MIKLQDGTRITRKEFDNRIRKAKAKLIQIFLEENGYIYCEQCLRSDIKPIDCSHIKSVDDCLKEGTPELAYDVTNMRLLCRKHHSEYDGLDIKKPKIIEG